MLQLQPKDSINFIIGREDDRFTVFSEEILLILLLFTIYSMLLLVLATVITGNLTFCCTKRRSVFWFGMDCYWFITLQYEKVFLLECEYCCVLSCIFVVTCGELSITHLWEINIGNFCWLSSITLLKETNTDNFPGDIVVNFRCRKWKLITCSVFLHKYQ